MSRENERICVVGCVDEKTQEKISEFYRDLLVKEEVWYVAFYESRQEVVNAWKEDLEDEKKEKANPGWCE